MCTYQTTSVDVRGSGKGAEGWFKVSTATVYFDHPVHASADHTLNIDLLNPERGPSSRVAMELDPDSARALAEAILHTLELARPFLPSSTLGSPRAERSAGDLSATPTA